MRLQVHTKKSLRKVVFARGLGVPIVMHHDYVTGGFTTNTSLTYYYHDNGLLPAKIFSKFFFIERGFDLPRKRRTRPLMYGSGAEPLHKGLGQHLYIS